MVVCNKQLSAVPNATHYEEIQMTLHAFLTGPELNNTPAKGLHTLYVDIGDCNDIDIILKVAIDNEVKAIRFQNLPIMDDADEALFDTWQQWDTMIECCLQDGYWCTLELPVQIAEQFLESPLADHSTRNSKLIPMILVNLSYIDQYNYNACIMIDDNNQTNIGTWTHSLRDLQSEKTLTRYNFNPIKR